MKFIGNLLYENKKIPLFLSKEGGIYTSFDELKNNLSEGFENLDLIFNRIKKIYENTNGILKQEDFSEYIEERVLICLLENIKSDKAKDILNHFKFSCERIKDKKYNLRLAKTVLTELNDYFLNK